MEKLAQQTIGRFLRPFYINNWPRHWGLKLISLLLALLLWYFVAGEDKVDTTVLVPVEIVNLPQELIVSNQFKKQLEVTVSGPRGLISGIARQHITRTVNLSKATLGTTVINNAPETINFPRGIKVLRIQPTHLTLSIDQLMEKTLPVEVRTEGSPAHGFELAGITIEPGSIRATGPRATLAQTPVLPTTPISLHGLKSTITLQVSLDLSPEILDLIGETVVTANVAIHEKTSERYIGNIPIHILGTAQKKVVDFNPTRVGARVRMPLSKNVEEMGEQIEARVQVEGLPPGVHRVPVEMVATDPLKVVEIQPTTVSVEIGK